MCSSAKKAVEASNARIDREAGTRGASQPSNELAKQNATELRLLEDANRRVRQQQPWRLRNGE